MLASAFARPAIAGVSVAGNLVSNNGTVRAKTASVVYPTDPTPLGCGMACDGTTDDTAAFAACVTTGGAACGKTLDMSGCAALISSPGNGATTTSLCDHTRIIGDGGSGTYFTFSAKSCGGTTTTAGAGCSTSANCRGAAPTCTGSQFAPSGQTVTFLGALSGANDLTFQGVNIKANQAPQWGICTTDSKPCRSYCDSGNFGGLDLTGYECDADSDCFGGTTCTGGTTGCCVNLSMCTGTNTCVTQGTWPAGTGTIQLFNWPNVSEATLQGFDVYDLAASTTAINVGANALVYDVNLLAASGPIAVTAGSFGDDWLGQTAWNVSTGILGGLGTKVDNCDARGSTNGIKVSSSSQNPTSVRNSFVFDKGASAVGIEGGANVTVEHDAVSLSGANAIGVKLTGANGTVRATTISVTGGGATSAGVYAAANNASLTDTNVSISGGATGIRFEGLGDILTDSSVIGASGTWGPAVVTGNQQATIVGNYFNSIGWCTRIDENAPSVNGIGASINWAFVGNRCFSPNVSCAGIVTGADFSNNYCAWLTPMATPLWIGDSGWHTTNLCTASNTPWSCCTGAEKGSCDGTSQNTTLTTTGATGLQATAFGMSTGHAKIVGNIFHLTGADNGSMVKVADVGNRCSNSSSNFSACTGAASSTLWGYGCRCDPSHSPSDCAGTGAACSASTGNNSNANVVIDGNLFFTSRSNVAGVDMLLDDDDFGVSTTSATRATSTATAINSIIVSGNAFTYSGRAFRFSTDATNITNTTKLALLSNLYAVGSTRMDNWKWSMGVKDDVPVAQLWATSYGANTAGATKSVPFFGSIPAPTTSNVADVAVPVGMNCFRLYCASDALPGASKTNAFTIVKNGSNAALTCTTAANVATCSDTTHEVSFTAGDNVAISDALTASGTATGISCATWCEMTGAAWW